MPFPSLRVTVSSSCGQVSRSTQVHEASFPLGSFAPLLPFQVERAVKAYADYLEDGPGAIDFRGRDFRLDAVMSPFVPSKPTTDLKIFNQQSVRGGGFMTGNAITNTQVSTYIRPSSMTEANGQHFAAGELRAFDLAGLFARNSREPGRDDLIYVLKAPENRDRMLIAYKVFHTTKARIDTPAERKIHGWVLTDNIGNLVEEIVPERFHRPIASVMDEATAAFTHAIVGEPRPLVWIRNGELISIDPEIERTYLAMPRASADGAPPISAATGRGVRPASPTPFGDPS